MSSGPAVPATAQEVFGARLPVAERYVEWLADAGTVRGLIGPREVPRLWERHVLNCAVLAELVPADATVADLGSGAGLPGLVLAIARPDLRLTLVEPLERRTAFLSEVREDLGLANVEVLRGRAEDLHGARRFQVVTSRALAPLDRLAGWSVPLVAEGGCVLAMKGSRAAEEIEAASKALRRLKAGPVDVVQVGAGVVDPPTTVVRIRSSLGGSGDRRGRRTSTYAPRRGGR